MSFSAHSRLQRASGIYYSALPCRWLRRTRGLGSPTTREDRARTSFSAHPWCQVNNSLRFRQYPTDEVLLSQQDLRSRGQQGPSCFSQEKKRRGGHGCSLVCEIRSERGLAQGILVISQRPALRSYLRVRLSTHLETTDLRVDVLSLARGVMERDLIQEVVGSGVNR